jgi:hypothetical protein
MGYNIVPTSAFSSLAQAGARKNKFQKIAGPQKNVSPNND